MNVARLSGSTGWRWYLVARQSAIGINLAPAWEEHMTAIGKRIGAAARAFAKSTTASVTIEFVMWVPVFMGIILLVADTSLIFMRQSNFWNVSRDTARIVARHGMDALAAEAYARQQAAFAGYTPEVEVNITASEVSVTISGLSRVMAPFGVLGFAMDTMISAQVTHALEPI